MAESTAERSQCLRVAGGGKGGNQAIDRPETHRAGRSGVPRNVSASDVLALASGQKAMAFWLGLGFGRPVTTLASAWPRILPGQSQKLPSNPAKSHGFLAFRSKPAKAMWPGLGFWKAKAMAFRPSQSQNNTSLGIAPKVSAGLKLRVISSKLEQEDEGGGGRDGYEQPPNPIDF
ncbi:hypothetical protein FB451DRAFT_121176 [Mycena latifolia]|nr:hypothetical protein FB451DRAFT_121176 [Mycena latifolia]